MIPFESLVRHLAAAFVSGQWHSDQLVQRGAQQLGRHWRWLRPLAARTVRQLGAASRPTSDQVAAVLRMDAGLRRAWQKHSSIRIDVVLHVAPEMAQAPDNVGELPPLVTAGQLAEWLQLSPAELDWFADRKGLERTTTPTLQHYRYRWHAKRTHGSARLIEAPKWRLKAIQRRILEKILAGMPPHSAAHGFRRGSSIRSFAQPHTGHATVVRMDLQDFFTTITGRRVAGVLQHAGYPEEVARLLAALCVNQVADEVWGRFPQFGSAPDRLRHEGLLRRPHLPQGAPTSPALANLCCRRLDRRLARLAGALDAQYTRYADDLLFSGDLQGPRRLVVAVGRIVSDEGFRVNLRKTRVMRSGVQQRAAGLTLNQHLNVDRREYDRLKAILFNCMRHGPSEQNRDERPDFRAHLDGRVAFVEWVCAGRGERLRGLFRQIDWA